MKNYKSICEKYNNKQFNIISLKLKIQLKIVLKQL